MRNDPPKEDDILKQVTEIVAAYVSKNPMPPAELPNIIKNVHATLGGIGGVVTEGAAIATRPPAVPVKKSVTPDYIVCLEDGKKLKMLKRHLRTTYNMTPDEYRAKWGLPPDYPMVAPSYAEKRRDLAKQIGLGRKPGARRGRPKKTA